MNWVFHRSSLYTPDVGATTFATRVIETDIFPFTVQAEGGGQTVGRKLVTEIGEKILPRW